MKDILTQNAPMYNMHLKTLHKVPQYLNNVLILNFTLNYMSLIIIKAHFSMFRIITEAPLHYIC